MASPVKQSMTVKCSYCKKEPQPNQSLQRCAKCLEALYCDRTCQRNHWPKHKEVCRLGTSSSSADAKMEQTAKTIIRPATHTLGVASPEPTTSGYLRWMNIWQDAHARGLIGKGPKKILVLGPGMREFGKELHCPQMAEALRLWSDGSHFTVLDSNDKVLGAVSSIDSDTSVRYISEAFKQNRGANYNPEIERRLTSVTKPKNTVELVEFRMGKDKLSKDLKFDIALATLSLYYAIKELAASGQDENREKRIGLLGEYLSAVPGGVMYVDEDLVIALLATPKDLKDQNLLRKVLSPQNMEKLTNQIKKNLDLDVNFIHLPLIQWLKESRGFPIVLQPKAQQEFATAAQTHNAYAIEVRARI